MFLKGSFFTSKLCYRFLFESRSKDWAVGVCPPYPADLWQEGLGHPLPKYFQSLQSMRYFSHFFPIFFPAAPQRIRSESLQEFPKHFRRAWRGEFGRTATSSAINCDAQNAQSKTRQSQPTRCGIEHLNTSWWSTKSHSFLEDQRGVAKTTYQCRLRACRISIPNTGCLDKWCAAL